MTKGKSPSLEHRMKISATMKGIKRSEETIRRMAECKRGIPRSEATKRKIATSLKGRKYTEAEQAAHAWRLAKRKGMGLSLETRKKISATMIGKRKSIEHRMAMSAAKQNIPFEDWNGFMSFEPYCYRFNEPTKEHIRNLCNRTCTICGKSTLQNISKNRKWLGRLAVDHLDENKMQGCDDWEWRLTALCHSCHDRIHKQRFLCHLLLGLLLLNNKRHQTNFLF